MREKGTGLGVVRFFARKQRIKELKASLIRKSVKPDLWRIPPAAGSWSAAASSLAARPGQRTKM